MRAFGTFLQIVPWVLVVACGVALLLAGGDARELEGDLVMCRASLRTSDDAYKDGLRAYRSCMTSVDRANERAEAAALQRNDGYRRCVQELSTLAIGCCACPGDHHSARPAR